MALLSPAGIGVKTNGRSAWLDAPAAASYRRMLAAGMPAGGITDAGRTNPEQWELWRAYLAGKLKATAAYPGTSKHETGRALDLTGAALAWARAHGREFGWIPDLVPNEPWHIEYRADRDKHLTAPTPEGDDMFTEEDRATLRTIRDEQARIGTRLKEIDTADEFVRQAYLAELGREADPDEVDRHVLNIARGLSQATLLEQIQAGAEAVAYRARKR